jgi:hypothetical protein
MSLDLNKVAPQVGGMAARLKTSSQQRRQHLLKALDVLVDRTICFDRLKEKIARSKTTWLVAGPVDGLGQHYQAPPPPKEYAVIASDGSHIDVDRHRSIRCYLINIGTASLSYGTNPDATLGSYPNLYSSDEDLVMVSPEGREQPVEGALLGIKRSVEECRYLTQILSEFRQELPTLALLDGSLILWGLASKDCPEFVVDALLDKSFLRYLDDIRKLSKERTIALASYISYPRSTDVVNALRVALCLHDTADCDHYCAQSPSGKRECDAVASVQDRELFSEILAAGERSALFTSQSQIVQKRYGAHRVYFFYLKVDEEIARVEIPQWVALDSDLLGVAHALVLDQCRRGQGYPIALSEAHEQAVVNGPDRENFQRLVEMSLAEEHIPMNTSAKSQSKRMRWV